MKSSAPECEPGPNDINTQFWTAADKTSFFHNRLMQAGGRIAVAGLAVAALSGIGVLGHGILEQQQYGVTLVDNGPEDDAPVGPTTTIETCSSRYLEDQADDLEKAIVELRACKNNPNAQPWVDLNAQLVTTTTSQPQN